MPGFLLHTGATIICPHGGPASIAPVNQRVKVNGMSVALATSPTTVAGCPFQVPIGTSTKPRPCVTVRWLVAATRVKILGQFVLLRTSSGVCQSAEQIAQGAPVVATAQTRVYGM